MPMNYEEQSKRIEELESIVAVFREMESKLRHELGLIKTATEAEIEIESLKNRMQFHISTLETKNAELKEAAIKIVEASEQGDDSVNEVFRRMPELKEALLTPSPVIEELREVKNVLLDNESSFHFLKGFINDDPKAKDFGWEKVFSQINSALSRLKSKWGL